MSNSRRWREFITWWNDLSTSNMDRADLENAIDKKIREIKEDAKSKFGKDNNGMYEGELNFRQGYYCAVANLYRMHNIGVEKELLQQYGKLNLDGIDEYDVKTIKEIIK